VADRGVDLAGQCPQFAGAAEVRAYLLAERVVVAEPGALGTFQPGQLGVGFGLVHEQRVPGGQGLDLAVGQGGVADVLDLADVQPAPHDLGDEPGFAFDGLPHVPVEGAFGDVAEDLHFVVVVALAQDAALALGDVGGPPRAAVPASPAIKTPCTIGSRLSTLTDARRGAANIAWILYLKQQYVVIPDI
jgi:hypothetical protein